MNNSTNIYTVTSSQSEVNDVLSFYFISRGQQDVIKIVHYAFVEESNGKCIYNLGFGDFNLSIGRIADSSNTNNGDSRKVFNTVLHTIPFVFEKYPEATLLIQGADSRPEFKFECRKRCSKSWCKEGICLKFNQRIRIYCGFLDQYLVN